MGCRGLSIAVVVSALAACSSGGGADGGTTGAAPCTVTCAKGLTCQAGACVPESCATDANCSAPLSCVGGFCTDQSCDPPCASNTSCLAQECIPKVPATCTQSSACGFGLSCVGGYCADSNCDPACASGDSCLDGVCIPQAGGSCQAPYILCYDLGGSYCADVQKDSVNCGGCGVICPSGEVCNGVGVCSVSCVSGETQCSNRCVDLKTDNLSCGACDTACASGQVCTTPVGEDAGSCEASCASGETSCTLDAGVAPYCADTTSDPGNCGGCGTVCPSQQVCGASTCAPACSAGDAGPFVICGGGAGGPEECTDTRFDVLNCGVCGMACFPSTTCLDSMCVTCGTSGTPCCGGATPCGDAGLTCTQGVCG